MITENDNTYYWHSEDCQTIIDKLDGSENGLNSDEVKERQIKFGKNQIHKTRGDGVLLILWRQLNNPLIWVLLSSTVLALLIGKITDGLVVLAVVIVNSIIGFIQEFKAGKAIEALSDMVPEYATVLRDGKSITIPVAELVPGDIVSIASGDRVPADMRLIRQKNLMVEEAALTGESLPVQKNTASVLTDAVLGDRTSMVYSGTLVSAGTATAIVVLTGMSTELGKISNMLGKTTDLETPLTKKLAVVGKYLTIGIIFITVLIMIVGTLRAIEQGVLLGDALKDSLIFAIALAVGAIPEGLPAVVTIALAIGVQRMAMHKAIIRKLPAVETLGSTTVICSDKTGTLTRNEMTVTELWTADYSIQVTGVGYKPEGDFIVNKNALLKSNPILQNLLTKTVLCSDSDVYNKNNQWEITGDPTEAALVVAAMKAGIDYKQIRIDNLRIDVLPFESENQYMATLNKIGEEHSIILKGAPEAILSRCVITSTDLLNVNNEIERMGKKGMRVLAVGQKDFTKTDKVSELTSDILSADFTLSGLIGMIDPPREEAIEAIKTCHNAGIIVKMITGDHRTTASSIGRTLNLTRDNTVVTGAELSIMDDFELQQTVEKVNIFARVAPEHKLRLVRALQSKGHIVAMTGDGVNDAPSLKQSNIGVAMGITGTSVSKESADIVLADDNFASISAAVEEGRRVYDNLIKSLAFILPTNLGLAFILSYSIFFFPFDLVTQELLLPMLPTQLLWINLVAAIALALPLAFEVKEPNIMSRPPRHPDEPLFNQFVTIRVVLVSLLMSAGTLFLFSWEYSEALSLNLTPAEALSKAQTIAVTYIIFFQIFYLFNCRSLRSSVLKIGFFSNPTIFYGVGFVIACQAAFIYNPIMQNIFKTSSLDLREILTTVAIAFIIFPIIGLEKLLNYWFEKRKKNYTINK